MDDKLLETTFAGRYRLISALGHGAMGSVYKAIDETLNRFVAIKVLAFRPEAENQPRAANEARMASRLAHPNILSIFDYGVFEGRAYVVMELVEGSSFAEIVRARRPLTLTSGVAVVAQIGDALQYAHKQGVIHGDIKPANILVSASGRVLLSDFGVATAVGGSTLTSAGLVLGTPKYMSPEQAMGRPLDGRSDIYSLAVVLHEALTDVSWISGESPAEILKRVVEETPPPIRNRNPHEADLIDPVLAKALAKNPGDRYQTADEFVRDLRRAVRPGSHTLEGVATFSPPEPPDSALFPGRTPVRLERWPVTTRRSNAIARWTLAGATVLLGLIISSRLWSSEASLQAVAPAVVGFLVAWWLSQRRFASQVSAVDERSASTIDDSGGSTVPLGAQRRAIDRGASAPRTPTQLGFSADATAAVAPYRPPEVAAGLTLRDPAAGSWLLVVDGPLSGQQFNLHDVVTIGRSADSTVRLLDTAVSRRQAEIVLRDDHFFIRDLGSRAGTLVNGAKIQERELRDRDEIQLGSTTLLFISAVADAERGGVDSKRRLDEFNAIWQELTRAAHGN